MPLFVMLTNLTPDGVKTLKSNPNRVGEVNKEVEQIGAKVVAQYATLGQYDFVTIVEAPDEQTMAKVSVELGSRGTMTSQTLAAMDSRRPRLGALASGPLAGFSSSGEAVASTRSSAPWPAHRSSRSCSARPATPGSPPTPNAVDVGAEDVEAIVAAARSRGGAAWSSSGPEAPLVAGAGRRARGGGHSGIRAGRGRSAARGLEGLRQGADGGGRGPDRLAHGAAQPRGSARADRLRVLSRRC